MTAHIDKGGIMNRLYAGAIALFVAQPALAADIRLVTEEYPPFNLTHNGKIAGLATDLVEATFHKAGISYTLEMLPWARAYSMAETTPGTCVYSTTETPERKDKFLWVGPLVNNDWVLMGRAVGSPAVSKLEEAKPYTIGGYNGDALALFLEQQGYKVELSPRDDLNPAKLANGRIDFWATGSESGPYLAQQMGITGLKAVATFKNTVMSLACNKGTDAAIVAKLQAGLDAVRAKR